MGAYCGALAVASGRNELNFRPIASSGDAFCRKFAGSASRARERTIPGSRRPVDGDRHVRAN